MEVLISMLKSCSNFKSVMSLNEYLSLFIRNTDSSVSGFRGFNDFPMIMNFQSFLDSTIICLNSEYTFPQLNEVQVNYSYCALVDNIIIRLLCKKSNENLNTLRLDDYVQTFGYCYYKSSSTLKKNPMISLILKSSDWENLYKYIGQDLTEHLIEGEHHSIFIPKNESLIQVIGINIAKFLKPKPLKPKAAQQYATMKEFKTNREKLQEKQDIFSKLPLVNKVKMLYNTLIRNKFKLSSKNLLNLKPSEAGPAIAKKILGARSKMKYFEQISGFFGKFSYNYQRLNLGAHIKKHCPINKDFKKDFTSNMQENFSFEFLFNCHSSLSQVTCYLITILKKVIPKGLLGSKKNLKEFFKAVIMFLKLGVWEKFSCAAVCSRFSISSFKWIKETAGSARDLLVGKIVLYIFNDFIIPLLQISFYITEKQHDNTVLYFYRKPLWALVTAKVKEKLESNDYFLKLNREEKQRWEEFTRFPHAKLRVQPKVSDFRPIMHFKSKIPFGNVRLSGNNLIAGVPQILRICLKDPEKVMSLDYPSLIAKIAEFSEKWNAKGKPELFYMCVDIAKAFDSVNTEKLIPMIDELEVPVVSAYYKFIQLLPRQLHRGQGSMQNLFKMKFKKQAISESQSPFFTDLTFRPYSINILTSRSTFATEEKLKMVSRVIQGNVIKFNRQFFKGLKGVPQGLPCSPLLSNLYYSNIEEKLIPELKQKYSNNLLFIIRLHDDYLILSDSSTVIKETFDQLEHLARSHNFQFASNKILSNIPGPWAQNNEIEGWVGLEISKDLQVAPFVSENAKRQISFDFVNSKVNFTDLKNKLIKMTNLTINLLRFRALADEDYLKNALRKLINLQACRFLALLKVIKSVYGKKHSNNAISRIVVNVMKFSGKILLIKDFFKVAVGEFAKVFKGSQMDGVYWKLKRYLEKMETQKNQVIKEAEQ